MYCFCWWFFVGVVVCCGFVLGDFVIGFWWLGVWFGFNFVSFFLWFDIVLGNYLVLVVVVVVFVWFWVGWFWLFVVCCSLVWLWWLRDIGFRWFLVDVELVAFLVGLGFCSVVWYCRIVLGFFSFVLVLLWCWGDWS